MRRSSLVTSLMTFLMTSLVASHLMTSSDDLPDGLYDDL
jgi:hypothetical protein